MKFNQIVFTTLLFWSISSLAEYRVFLLTITNSKTNSARTVKSTLDPEQYKMIYLLKPDESITYTATWRCRGNTSELSPLCENPNRASLTPQQAQRPEEVQISN